MSYVIDTLAELAVVRVRFDGAVHLHDRAEALDDLIRRCAGTAWRGLLVDFSRAQPVDACPLNAAAHAARLAREPLLRGMRVAYVGASASEESVESLAALRGYFYQRFRTQGAALMWLCGEQALQLAA
ncbi:hypothetical protein [Lysobacter sp.]|uniref:hypothetical protein n=1 Tax=Lysobacter sp. TaxID=72226 RepID=UPI002D658F23|nr:hypothetical protein [Lysobacter sp.]HZX78194.1 hypothetical protein [Lysobacter sp.]